MEYEKQVDDCDHASADDCGYTCHHIECPDCGLLIQTNTKQVKRMSYIDHLPEHGAFTEEDLWEAIAEANGLDVSEIMDGDLVEWL